MLLSGGLADVGDLKAEATDDPAFVPQQLQVVTQTAHVQDSVPAEPNATGGDTVSTPSATGTVQASSPEPRANGWQYNLDVALPSVVRENTLTPYTVTLTRISPTGRAYTEDVTQDAVLFITLREPIRVATDNWTGEILGIQAYEVSADMPVDILGWYNVWPEYPGETYYRVYDPFTVTVLDVPPKPDLVGTLLDLYERIPNGQTITKSFVCQAANQGTAYADPMAVSFYLINVSGTYRRDLNLLDGSAFYNHSGLDVSQEGAVFRVSLPFPSARVPGREPLVLVMEVDSRHEIDEGYDEGNNLLQWPAGLVSAGAAGLPAVGVVTGDPGPPPLPGSDVTYDFDVAAIDAALTGLVDALARGAMGTIGNPVDDAMLIDVDASDGTALRLLDRSIVDLAEAGICCLTGTRSASRSILVSDDGR